MAEHTPPRPEYVTGPHGASRRVVDAIVKRDRGAPAFRARKRPESLIPTYVPGWIARCGNAPRGCRGILGHPTGGYLIKQEFKLPRAVRIDSDAWYLTHPDKYRGDSVPGYVVMDPTNGHRSKDGGKIGARSSLQLNTFQDAEAPGEVPGGGRRIVGQLPLPPCIVFCPICGSPNWVESPNGIPPHIRLKSYR